MCIRDRPQRALGPPPLKRSLRSLYLFLRFQMLWTCYYRFNSVAVSYFYHICVATLFDYRTSPTVEFWIGHTLLDARVEVDMNSLSRFKAPYCVTNRSDSTFTYALLQFVSRLPSLTV